ncbi:MAG: TIGR02281 family clan AA aspartic protease [Devosiaceae bacterium]|nr:TIGR02281 family clan AA aspartic protease [Devosiaceae bacterium MH13]
MRLLLVALVSFAAGSATTFGLLGGASDATLRAAPASDVAAAPQPTRPPATRPSIQQPAPTGGDERFRLGPRGHVETYAEIDGADLKVLIDTGATRIALRESDARRAGYRLADSDFTVPVRTANGTTYAAPILLRSVEVGSIRVRNVEALVSCDEQLGVNLLGMSFLQRLDGFRFENGYLLLEN